MLAHALREISARRGPAAGVAVAVIVGVTGFTLLTTNSREQRLETVGAVQAASQQSFDLLVRPHGTRLDVERKERLIQPGYLNGLSGIRMDQLATIRATPGVAVAAPVAVLGFFTPHTEVPVDLTRYASRKRPSAFRVDATWTLPDGSVMKANPRYTVTTPAGLGVGGASPVGDVCGPGGDGSGTPHGSTVSSSPPNYWCHTQPDNYPANHVAAGHVADYVPIPFPMLVTAVDPTAEAELLPLQGSVSGAKDALAKLSAPADDRSRKVPALVSSSSPVNFSLKLDASKLPDASADTILAGKALNDAQSRPDQHLFSQQTTSDDTFAVLRKELGRFTGRPGYAGNVFQYWTPSGLSLFQRSGTLDAQPVENDLTTLWVDFSDFSIAPPGTNDVSFRTLTLHRRYQEQGEKMGDPPALVSAGSFDPAKLASGVDDISRILAGYATAPSRDANGKPVAITPNIASVVQAPPTVLVNLNSVRRLTDGWSGPSSAGPISAIRIKVAGVTGVDDLSRERVRLAAQRIRKATGLDVDITVGSSPTTRKIQVPAGRFGRPAETIRQDWVKLGVATRILNAVDKKSLLLFVLVLLVATITTANSVIASVRSRRTEIGVLACVGWGRRAILRLLMTELTLLAVGSGLVAFLTSLALARLSGIHLTMLRAALALPAAVLVVLIAGLIPVLRATRMSPLEAVHPAVSEPRRIGPVRTVTALGWTNVRRVPARSVLATAALALATATFTLLLAIAVGFRGAVVGSVLGDAVAVEARRADYAAAVATLVLAGIGMANLTYLNIRDRSVELATLMSVGWTPGRVQGLLALEGAVLGAIGGCLGATVGYLAAWLLFGALPPSVLAAAGVATLLTTAIALGAAVATASRLDRLPLTLLLTE